MNNHFRFSALIGVFLLCSFSIAEQGVELKVAVATNFVSTVKDLTDKYEEHHDANITIISGSSGQLFAQIQNGAPYDVFLSADEAKIDAIVDENLGLDDSRITYALGILCFMLSPKQENEYRAEKKFESLNFNRIVLANSRLAPYGVAAEEVFDSLDVDLKKEGKKVVLAENIGKTYTIVRTGNADAGLVALSSILDDDLDSNLYYTVPEKLYSPIRQDAIVLKRTKVETRSRAFLKYIASNEARSIIRSNGYALD